MCTSKPAKCGSSDIYLSQRGQKFRNITALNKGETCQYRFYAECGAPIFKTTSSNSNFNITYVEWEEAAPSNIKKNWTWDLQKENALKLEIQKQQANIEAANQLTLKTRAKCLTAVRTMSEGTARAKVLQYMGITGDTYDEAACYAYKAEVELTEL